MRPLYWAGAVTLRWLSERCLEIQPRLNLLSIRMIILARRRGCRNI